MRTRVALQSRTSILSLSRHSLPCPPSGTSAKKLSRGTCSPNLNPRSLSEAPGRAPRYTEPSYREGSFASSAAPSLFVGQKVNAICSAHETRSSAHRGMHISRWVHPGSMDHLHSKVRQGQKTRPGDRQRMGGKLRGGALRMVPAGPRASAWVCVVPWVCLAAQEISVELVVLEPCTHFGAQKRILFLIALRSLSLHH